MRTERAETFNFTMFHRCRMALLLVLLIPSLAFGVAACSDTSRSVLTKVTGGATDDPAPGFADVKPGSEEDFIMAVGRRVYFRSGSAKLDDVAQETLQIQAVWLNKYTNWLVKVQGFADDPGTGYKNVSLSDQRAKAVMEYLSGQGVDPQRMWAKGYGKERIVRSCAELSCKALNRRAIVNLRKEYDAAAPQFKG